MKTSWVVWIVRLSSEIVGGPRTPFPVVGSVPQGVRGKALVPGLIACAGWRAPDPCLDPAAEGGRKGPRGVLPRARR